MLEGEKFDQRDVYANNVRIYRQFGRMYEPSLDIPKLYDIYSLRTQKKKKLLYDAPLGGFI